jgi:predicted enzyme related to lactoylglutathione lyase
MDFGVGVGNLDAAATALAARGVQLHGPPQSLDVGNGEWRYVYIHEPDGNYVQLVEARY